MSSTEQVPDAELARDVAAGDEAALAELYDRYSTRLFDFAKRTVRDADASADVVQATFLKAWGSLQRRDPPEHVRPWLFTIARNEAIDEIRRRRRISSLVPGEGDAPYDRIDESRYQDPEGAFRDAEMAELVWAAAKALKSKDYALLDMHLRQDLSAEEIAGELGVATQNVYKKLSRLRAAVEEAVADELLRRRRGECTDLDEVVRRIGNEGLTPRARRAISKHTRSCETCQERRRRLTAPAAIFAALAPIPLDAALQDQIFDGVSRRLAETPPGTSPSFSCRLTDRWWATPIRTRVLGVAGIAAGLTLFMVLLALWPFSNQDVGMPEDPGDIRSTSHTIGQRSDEDRIVVTWTPIEGARGYSVAFDNGPRRLPDETIDIAGDAGSVVSDELPDGTWYFHLRTQDAAGNWTSTVHLGPFLIKRAATPASSPTSVQPTEVPTRATPKPSATPSVPVIAVTPSAPAQPASTATVATTATAIASPAAPAATPTTPATTPTPTATPFSTPPASPTPDPADIVAGTHIYNATFGAPAGGCGYGAFSDTITLTLHPDGTATLAQAQHLSTGNWSYDNGTLTVSLTLAGPEPETYQLTSSNDGATLSGQNTYTDAANCISTFPVSASRT